MSEPSEGAYIPAKVCKFFVDALKSHFLCGVYALVSGAAVKGDLLVAGESRGGL